MKRKDAIKKILEMCSKEARIDMKASLEMTFELLLALNVPLTEQLEVTLEIKGEIRKLLGDSKQGDLEWV